MYFWLLEAMLKRLWPNEETSNCDRRDYPAVDGSLHSIGPTSPSQSPPLGQDAPAGIHLGDRNRRAALADRLDDLANLAHVGEAVGLQRGVHKDAVDLDLEGVEAADDGAQLRPRDGRLDRSGQLPEAQLVGSVVAELHDDVHLRRRGHHGFFRGHCG